MRARWMILLAQLVACGYSPKSIEGHPPCGQGCPPGYTCLQPENQCWKNGEAPDAGGSPGDVVATGGMVSPTGGTIAVVGGTTSATAGATSALAGITTSPGGTVTATSAPIVGGAAGAAGTTALVGGSAVAGGTTAVVAGNALGGTTPVVGGSSAPKGGVSASAGNVTPMGGSVTSPGGSTVPVAGSTARPGGTTSVIAGTRVVSSSAGISSGGTPTGGTTTVVTSGTTPTPGKFVGNIDTRSAIRSDFVKYWNQFSPENAGKWGSVQGSSQTTFNWNTLDTFYKYCHDNNIIFKEYTFIWGAQQPTWADASIGQDPIRNWMKSFCERYPEVQIIDVVNEPPPHTTPKYIESLGGAGTSGFDWIANAFKWAREFCPKAILVLNDYNNAELSGDAKRSADIANAIKAAGAPIDAIGCQVHGASNMGSATLKTNIESIVISTGLPVYITQYDINQADDQLQLQRYQDHITMFWNHPNIKGITIWGYVVGATWIANSGIMQNDGTMRPAMTWLMDFLKR